MDYSDNVATPNASVIDRPAIATATLEDDRSTILLQRLHIAMDHDAISMQGITLESFRFTMLLSSSNFKLQLN